MQPTCFSKHGGHPCFFLDPGPMRNTWSELEAGLREFANTLNKPISGFRFG